MGTPDHECVKDESFKELTKELKGLVGKVGEISTDLAVMQRDVTDLKQVTVTMSECIRALTESAIKAGENNITRGQFYEKIDEIAKTRDATVKECMKEFHEYVEIADKRFEALESKAQDNKSVCDDYKGLKKWLYGLAGSLILFFLYEGYRILIHAT